jgi:tRNA A-37 threonylcarbamoyl transferase component Bud32
MSKAIELEVGAFRWHILPELLHNDPNGSAANLFHVDGPPLDEWRSGGVARVVKDGPHRTVYRVVLPGLDFYLKQYRLADARARLRELVRPSKARLEWDRTLAVAERGVPTIAPLAFGEARDRTQSVCSFLATRTLVDAVPLNAFLEMTLPDFAAPRKTRVRQRIAMALGELLAAMHDAGVTQHDLHPGNVLLRLDEADKPYLHLIDLYAVQVGEPLTWDASRANLVVFNRWFMLRSERSDRLRFWHAYHRSRRHVGGPTWFSATTDSKPPAHVEAVRDIERRSLKSNVRFWRALDKRCLGTNRYFRKVQHGEVAGHVVADLPRDVVQSFFADPDESFRRPDAQFLKQSPSSTVIALDLPGNDGPRRVIYKRFAVGHWTDPFVALVRRTPALRSYVLGHGLRLRCLPTPRPLGVWHRYKYGLAQEGYLLTELIPDAIELHKYVKQLLSVGTNVDRTRLRTLIDQLARLVGMLHHRHLSHRDLKASNVLVSNNHLTFIDLVGVMRHRKLRRSRRIQNLARLNVSSLGCAGLTRTDKLRFLRVYLRWGLRGKQGWKEWWRALEKTTADKIDRNRRRGRPLG